MKKITDMMAAIAIAVILFSGFSLYADAAETSGKRLVRIEATYNDAIYYVNDESGKCITQYQQFSPSQTIYQTTSYNSSGEISEILTEIYNPEKDTWKSHQKETRSYNDAGLLTSVMCYEYDDTTGAWNIRDDETETYTYDASGNMLKHTSGTHLIREYEYDAAGHCTKLTETGESAVITEYQYNGDQLEWEKRGTDRTRYEYENGTVTEYSETNPTPEDDAAWSAVSKNVTVTSGNTKTVTDYNYENQEWVSTDTHEITYNEAGAEISDVWSRWSNLYEKTEWTYDSEGDLLSEVIYSRSEEEWTEKERKDYFYMDNLDILNGKNQTVFPDGSQTLTFRSEAPLEEFSGIRVDGKPCSSDNYDTSSGSTIVTLHADYLQTLEAGQHTLSIISTGGIATVDFYTTSAPPTGDDRNMFGWGLLLLSAAVVTFVLVRSGRRVK